MKATKKNWRQRAAEHRKAAVLEIFNRPEGESISKAICRVSKRYNGRPLPGGKRLRLSAATLKRLWYAWKADPSDKIFNINYPERSRESMPPWLVELIEFYAIESKCTLMSLHRRLVDKDPGFPFGMRRLYRHVPAETRNRIAASARKWRQAEALYRKLEKITGEKP